MILIIVRFSRRVLVLILSHEKSVLKHFTHVKMVNNMNNEMAVQFFAGFNFETYNSDLILS